MCGIAGWVDWGVDRRHELPVLAAMGETLACRGPDERGVWQSPACSFYHRRLVVIDPEGGKQPMRLARGGRGAVINYNGELYNTEDLRAELRAHGWTFAGHSDTEVLLASYLEWGPACVEKLNGIFAFAIWDEAEQRLLLARDRLGVKPLFYARRGRLFLFASELKALLAHPAVRPEIDAEGLAEIVAIGPARTPGHGVFRDVRELKPGHAMLVGRDGVRAYPYWRLESRPHTDDRATTVRTVRELVQDAAERQLVSDVPVCTLLSGGVDSSTLTAFAAARYRREGRPPLATYSVDYVGNDRFFRANDFQPDLDAPWVAYVSHALGTQHHTVVLDHAELAEHLGAAVEARDLPGMADVDVSLLLFCREIKKGATVAISGECADEIFGGYPWFRRPEALAAGTFPWSLKLKERFSVFSPEVIRWTRAKEYLAERYLEALAEVPRLEGEAPADARIREMKYLNLTRWMPTLLDRKDRMSMAVGLEIRVPFCDHRLVEYVWNVPWSLMTMGGIEKGLLREAVRDVLPAGVLARRKSPYPKTHNPAYLEAVRQRTLAMLDDPTAPLRDLIDVEAVRAFAQAGAEQLHLPWFGQLMSGPQLLAYLLQIDHWLRRYRVSIR